VGYFSGLALALLLLVLLPYGCLLFYAETKTLNPLTPYLVVLNLEFLIIGSLPPRLGSELFLLPATVFMRKVFRYHQTLLFSHSHLKIFKGKSEYFFPSEETTLDVTVKDKIL